MSTTCIIPCKDHLLGHFHATSLTNQSEESCKAEISYRHSCCVQTNNSVPSISYLTHLGRVQPRIDCEFDGQIFEIDRFKGTCGVIHKMDGSSQIHPNNFNIP